MRDPSNKDNQDIWQEIVGATAGELWAAFGEVAPPRSSFCLHRTAHLTSWKIATAASLAVCILFSGVIYFGHENIAKLETQVALLQLESQVMATQLHGANFLRARAERLSDPAKERLTAILPALDDPNVQLEVLEILIMAGTISTAEDLPLPALSDDPRIRYIHATYASLYSPEVVNEGF